MRAVAFLSLVVLVCGAPLNEQNSDNEIQQDDDKVNLVKRAKEFMMFGDQQGEYKEKEKRSDPLDETVDAQGAIVAEPAREIEQEQPSEEEQEVEAPQVHSDENVNLPVDGNMVNDEESDDESQGEMEEVNTPEAVGQADEVEPQESSETDDNKDADVTPEAQLYDDYLKNYGNDKGNYLMDLLDNQYNRWEPTYPNSYNLYDYLTGGRYRRSQRRRSLAGIPQNRVLKRARRIKRDLYFTSDILGRNYDSYPDERYVEDPYGSDQVDLDDDEIRYLLNLLDNAQRYDDDVNEYDNQLYQPNAGYYGPEVEPDDSDFYIPKRQAGLTFVPGLKRSREFFPYFQEPNAHFAAFVPQKRSRNDYADAYQRLMELAAELRAESYYPGEEYDFENYYRRK